MFVDKVLVTIQAGDGGDGAVSFRHEKFVDKGGPDGGDGGKGGDVILQASRNQNTLASFRYQKLLQAPPGKPGSKRRKHGRSGQDFSVLVPVGTQVLDAEGTVIADLTQDEQRAVIAKGGKGGFGNAHFVSSTRQLPRVAEKGEKGEGFQVTFELKMIADVGLVGLPNAGKSTLLAAISNARPEIADYPFTTLTPNLGVVDIDEGTSLLVADIPGLIEGASKGKGLGDEFLRHVERTNVLIHVIDAYQEDIGQAYRTIQQELKEYKVDLTGLPQVVALNKVDGMDEHQVTRLLAVLQSAVPPATPLFAISAVSGHGVRDLLFAVKDMVYSLREAAEAAAEEPVPVLRLAETDGWQLEKRDDYYIITGAKIERFARRTDFGNPAGVERLRDIMRKMGIMKELARKGAEPGQTVHIGQSSVGTITY